MKSELKTQDIKRKILKISFFLFLITNYQLLITNSCSFAQPDHSAHQKQAPVKQEIKKEQPEKEVKEQKSQKKKIMYHCPMHPTYISDKPGDCPICNMKLVPIEEKVKEEKPTKIVTKAEEICITHNCPMQPCPMRITALPDKPVKCIFCGVEILPTGEVRELMPEGAVMITPEKQQLIGVKTEAVLKRHLTKIIRTVGKIAYDPELYKAEQEFIEANKTLKEIEKSGVSEVIERSKALVEASRLKLRLNGLGDEQINNLINTTTADRGLLISDEKTPYVWAYITIYEYEIDFVKVGQTVELQAVSHPGEIFKGKITAIDPVLDEMTRSVRVRALIDNKEGKLKPNMFADITINVDLGEKLAIPEEAVMDTGERKIVFVSKPNGYFEPRNVKLRNKAEGYYEVLEGVFEKENVVTSGNFLIDSESKLKSAISSGAHQHGQ